MKKKDTITSWAQDVVLCSTTSARDLARLFGKPYPTMMRELNPNDPGAKLGVETFYKIIAITRDITPLQTMAEKLGYTLKKK